MEKRASIRDLVRGSRIVIVDDEYTDSLIWGRALEHVADGRQHLVRRRAVSPQLVDWRVNRRITETKISEGDGMIVR